MPNKPKPEIVAVPDPVVFVGMPWWGKLLLQTGAFGVVCMLLVYLTYSLTGQAATDRQMFQQQLETMRSDNLKRADKVEQIHERALSRIERASEKACESMDKAAAEMQDAARAFKTRPASTNPNQ